MSRAAFSVPQALIHSDNKKRTAQSRAFLQLVKKGFAEFAVATANKLYLYFVGACT